MMTAARSTVAGTAEARKISPTSARERRCVESSRTGTPVGVSPPR